MTGINLQSPQSDSTPWTLTLLLNQIVCNDGWWRKKNYIRIHLLLSKDTLVSKQDSGWFFFKLHISKLGWVLCMYLKFKLHLNFKIHMANYFSKPTRRILELFGWWRILHILHYPMSFLMAFGWVKQIQQISFKA